MHLRSTPWRFASFDESTMEILCTKRSFAFLEYADNETLKMPEVLEIMISYRTLSIL